MGQSQSNEYENLSDDAATTEDEAKEVGPSYFSQIGQAGKETFNPDDPSMHLKKSISYLEMDSSRDWECVLVFDLGDDEEWDATTVENYAYQRVIEGEEEKENNFYSARTGADFVRRRGGRVTRRNHYEQERLKVIKALTHMKLRVKEIKNLSPEKYDNKQFWYIGIDEKIARDFADSIGHELRINPDMMIEFLNLMDESLAQATKSDEPEAEMVKQEYWDNMYIKYFDEIPDVCYEDFPIRSERDKRSGLFERSLFRTRDRITLIQKMVESDFEEGGCGIFVPMLKYENHTLDDFFPLHNVEHLKIIRKSCFGWNPFKRLPLDDIRDYFGEYVALYFAFLEFYTRYLYIAAVLGPIFGIYQYVTGRVIVPGVTVFCLGVVVWASLFPVAWKRREYNLAMRWGQTRFDFQEGNRPQYEGEYVLSNVDGSREEYFDPAERYQRMFWSYSMALCVLIGLMLSVFAIVFARVIVASFGVIGVNYYVAIFNALFIMFLNYVYGPFATYLNDWENYQTDTMYENNLIIKVFIFRFVNSYASLYYIVFLRRFIRSIPILSCLPHACMIDLRIQLAVIFLTQLFVSNAIELLDSVAERCRCRVDETVISAQGFDVPDESQALWAQYNSEVYESTFDDYNELIIQWGYVTLFVIAWPLAPAFALIATWIEARIDAYKMTFLIRRPFPRGADDIGAWQIVLEVMAWAVLLTNVALMTLTNHALILPFVKNVWFASVLMALILCVILIGILWGVSFIFYAAPDEFDDHVARQNHVEAQITAKAKQINRYLDKLNARQLLKWREWKTSQIMMFLQHVILFDIPTFRKVAEIFKQHTVTGKRLDQLDEQVLIEWGIDEPGQARFLIYAIGRLKDQVERVEEQSRALDRVDDLEAGGGSRGGGAGAAQEHVFTSKDWIHLANFYKNDASGQARQRLWSRVDKDKSAHVEVKELRHFLYLAIATFVFTYNPDAPLEPEGTDHMKLLLVPFAKWLLDHKVRKPGISFAQFENDFPGWVREFVKSDEFKSMYK